MILEKIQIHSFGNLEEREFTLMPGVNIIEGANECGKSTIAAFIRFILYGVTAKERERFASWKTGGAAGSITLSDRGRRYRVERAYLGNREAVQLIDAANNMPIRGALDGKTPGEVLFGVDAEMFSATAFVSQLGASTDGDAVSEGIENILFSADESINTQKALSRLDGARAALLYKNEKGGRLYALANECADLETRLAAAMESHKAILSGEAQLADITGNLAASEEKARTIGAKIAQFEAVTLLGLFGRMRTMEKRVADLKREIEESGAPDPEYVNEVGDIIKQLELLRTEREETAARCLTAPAPTMPQKLKDYHAAGGREALEGERESARMTARTYTWIGVIVLLLGIGALALGVLPVFAGGSPQLVMAVIGLVMAAAGVTLLVLGGRSRSRAAEISDTYDFDEMDAEMKSYREALEASRLYELTAADVRRRYEAVKQKAKKISGTDEDGLSAKFAVLQEKMKQADGLKAEYDKHASLLAHMREQLSAYDEAELREQLQPDVDISDVDASTLPALRRDAEVASKMAASLTRHKAELEKTLAGLYPTAEDPAKLSDKLEALKLERSGLEKRHAAYKLAYEKLEEASGHLRESVAPRLASDAAARMSEITGGKYRNLGVGSRLEMTADTAVGQRSMDFLSAGTQDAAYLSLRLALVKLLYKKSHPPMIFDESFVRQDDERLTNLLRMIHSQDMQSLLFTSNGRDAAKMALVGEFNHIMI